MSFKLAPFIDLTLLKANATPQDIKELCQQAHEHQFASVCVNPCHVSLCAELLKESPVEICTVIGFPLGANTSFIKASEAFLAQQQGATEVDMVLNIALLKSGNEEALRNEFNLVRKAVPKLILKIILETAYLDSKEKILATKLAIETGADFVKTSTGFATSGATAEDIRLLKKTTRNKIKIKASGGIRTKEFAEELLSAGANRLGIGQSAALSLIRENPNFAKN